MLLINQNRNTKISNSVEGQIQDISFFGDYIQYKIKLLMDKQLILVSEMNSQEGTERKFGDQVFVSWDPNSFVVFD